MKKNKRVSRDSRSMLAHARTLIGTKLTASGDVVKITHRGSNFETTSFTIKVIKQKAWRWKLELKGNTGEVEVLTGKIYLDDLTQAVRDWTKELSNDDQGLTWVATIVGV